MTNPTSPYETVLTQEFEAYENPEAEGEWETMETEAEWENFETENEWETLQTESEWETPNGYYEAEGEYENEWEAEYEGDYFLSGAWKKLKKVGKVLAPIAKRIAPKLAGSLVSMIPGVGPVLSPLASKATKLLLKEGEAEAEMLEAEMLVTHEGEFEIGESEVAQQTALTEFLAAQAAEAQTEAEAEAALGATLPITITIMGGNRAIRPVLPVLAQANAKLVAGMRRQGPAGQELLRTIPTIQRNTIGALKAASRRGQRITAPLAIKTLAAATHKALSSPSTVVRAVERNNLLRKRVAPSVGPRRAGAPRVSNGTSRKTPTVATFRPGQTKTRHPVASRYI
jgi:hypothetical protein